jgi:hypothetical protein
MKLDWSPADTTVALTNGSRTGVQSIGAKELVLARAEARLAADWWDRDVACYTRFRLKGLEPVPNPVPNLGIRGEWRGKEVEECQQLTDSHHPPGGFESLPSHQLNQRLASIREVLRSPVCHFLCYRPTFARRWS